MRRLSKTPEAKLLDTQIEILGHAMLVARKAGMPDRVVVAILSAKHALHDAWLQEVES